MKIAIVHGSPRSGGVSSAMADRLAARLDMRAEKLGSRSPRTAVDDLGSAD